MFVCLFCQHSLLESWKGFTKVFSNGASPGGSSGKELACQCRRQEMAGSIPGSGRSSGGGHGNPFPYSCWENPHGRRSLASYSPWDLKESDTTEQLTHTRTRHRCQNTAKRKAQSTRDLPSECCPKKERNSGEHTTFAHLCKRNTEKINQNLRRLVTYREQV